MSIYAFWLFIRALCGDAPAAQVLMSSFPVPTPYQNLLTKTQNVHVQSYVARYTDDLSHVVFHFRNLKDMDKFQGLCSDIKYKYYGVRPKATCYNARVVTMGARKLTFAF